MSGQETKDDSTGPPALFRVRVWDNFHYMDEEEAYDHGVFSTYEEALAAAQSIVQEEVAHYGFDIGQYCTFGADPAIIVPSGFDAPPFSARDYARELCEARVRSDAEP